LGGSVSRKLVFHPAAAEEVAEAQTWYAERSELAAEAFALEVDLVVRRVVEAPERYATYLSKARAVLFSLDTRSASSIGCRRRSSRLSPWLISVAVLATGGRGGPANAVLGGVDR